MFPTEGTEGHSLLADNGATQLPSFTDVKPKQRPQNEKLTKRYQWGDDGHGQRSEEQVDGAR